MLFFTKGKKGIDQFALRCFAVAAMIADTVAAYFFNSQRWLTDLRWFSFTIFAWLLCEGYRRTLNRRLYTLRLFLFAVISEICFNMMDGGAFIYPESQSAMMTILLGFLSVMLLDYIRTRGSNVIITAISFLIIGISMTYIASGCSFFLGDWGIWIILICYEAGNMTYPRLYELLGFTALISLSASDFFATPIHGGHYYLIPAQIFIYPAMLLIWCYNGERGLNNLAFRRISYILYPAMCFITGILLSLGVGA